MTITCIVPARNEEGHLRDVILQVLSISEISQVIIVEGGSKDATLQEAREIAKEYPLRIQVLEQQGIGKFNAVLTGARFASNDLVMIWDADGTVPLHSTKHVIDKAVAIGGVNFGNRLMGHREKGSMQFANFIGNWVFSFLWAPLLNGMIIDLLCGTKILPRSIFSVIPPKLQRMDPYGDFALIFSARMQGFKVNSVPVDYKARSYGSTNIRRWSGGLTLLKVTLYCYFLKVIS